MRQNDRLRQKIEYISLNLISPKGVVLRIMTLKKGMKFSIQMCDF